MQERQPLDQLPDYWRERIRRLRAENHSLRTRIKATEEVGLSAGWHKKLTKIRAENARYRVERNEARAELAALRAELR